ncbi:hypothetical protein [Sphingomonas colocasiae]|uniref:CRISPR-associated protein Cas2 n=1 Tax=Sphingomonas colocasiae TaxID=1848973 RepID=A0ABS7PMB4_9SPHN|nr:hypothetical protein [Sphingomonas colocasiae]MBY8821850.1 hypothetical protein [Sphingomonas colocasiae]
MSVLLVACDLKLPDENYSEVRQFLAKFTHCRKLDSVWLIDTKWSPDQMRDGLNALIDRDDAVFVTRLAMNWASSRFGGADWLNDMNRNW